MSKIAIHIINTLVLYIACLIMCICYNNTSILIERYYFFGFFAICNIWAIGPDYLVCAICQSKGVKVQKWANAEKTRYWPKARYTLKKIKCRIDGNTYCKEDILAAIA